MNKKLKIIIITSIIIVSIALGLWFIDKQTTYQTYTIPKFIGEKDGKIEISIIIGISVGYIHHYDLVEIDDGVYRIDIYCSLLHGDNQFNYFIDNKDGHIKEIRAGEDGEVVIYKQD